MSTTTGIEWTDATWNPVTGCTTVSPGCEHCYARTLAERFRGTPGHHYQHGFDVTLRPDTLTAPLHWRRPRRVFVNSMSDLFHTAVPDEYTARVFAVIAATPQHTYQLLTKRHARMRSLLLSHFHRFEGLVEEVLLSSGHREQVRWPLPNLWLGVSVEDQQRAGLRIPALLDTPAAVRFLSCEPLLAPIDLTPWLAATHRRLGLDWVIVGGESGHGARPMHPDWAAAVVEQCAAARVPVFVKQLGTAWAREQPATRHPTNRKGGDWARWPAELRIRQYPTARRDPA